MLSFSFVSMDKVTQNQVIAQNRRARYDYFIDETFEAGLVLYGSEIKSLRGGNASIAESYAGEQGGELYLFNASISHYKHAATRFALHDVRRSRKLLVHRRQMNKLLGAIRRQGVTVVPLSLYITPRGIAKIQLGLARGKRKSDKREIYKKRDWQREKVRIMRAKGKTLFLKE